MTTQPAINPDSPGRVLIDTSFVNAATAWCVTSFLWGVIVLFALIVATGGRP